MADNPFGFWSEEWLRAHENYWSAWQALSGAGRAGKSSPEAASNPWSDALERWWQTASPAAPAPVQEFYNHLVEQGKVFFNLTDSWRSVASRAADGAHAMEDWQRLLQQSLESFKASASTGHVGGDKTFREMIAFWELPMDTWERTAAVMSGLPGDFLESFKLGVSGEKADPVREQLNRFLSVPGLGYTREHQEQYQSLAKLLIDYQYAKQEFAAEFVKIAAGTVDRFQGKVKDISAKNETVTSLQGFYDLWVDAAEEAYAERVFSEEYARAHGRLVNSLMAVKKQGRAMVDEVLGMLNMPTEQEINTVQARFQELRRELRALRSEVAAARVVQQPRAPTPTAKKPATSVPETPVKRTAPARKKAVVKKKAAGKVAGGKTGAAERRQQQS